MIQTSKIEWRQILTIRVARPILDGAGHAHHALGPAVVRSDLGVGDWPIHVVTIERGRREVEAAKPPPPTRSPCPPPALPICPDCGSRGTSSPRGCGDCESPFPDRAAVRHS